MNKKAKATTGNKIKKPIAGNPIYGPDEDIYNRAKKEELEEAEELKNEGLSPLSKGLDVPGSELDDENEKIGEEDEENNYYSIGGDAHEDLEEDKG